MTNGRNLQGPEIPADNPAKRWKISNLSCFNGDQKAFQALKSEQIQFMNCFSESGEPDAGDGVSGFEASRSIDVQFTNCISKHSGVSTGKPHFRVVNASRHVTFVNCNGELNIDRPGRLKPRTFRHCRRWFGRNVITAVVA